MIDTAPAYALHVTHEDEATYQTLRAVAVEIQDGSPRNISARDYGPPEPLAGLTVTAQADRRYILPDDADRTASYAWRIGLTTYDTFRADQVAATLATLRKIDKSLAKVSDAYGPARTFGALVARVATALAVPVITGHAGPDHTYTTGEWTTWTPGTAADIIDGWTATFRRPR